MKVQWGNGAGQNNKVSNKVSYAPAGVATVRVIISGPGMSNMQQDFLVGAGSGAIQGVPTGSDRIIRLEGLDASNATLWVGIKVNVSVVAGQNKDAGTIIMTTSNVGLVAHYPFNGNANDESGNGNNGTVSGATLATDRFGSANSAYSFDGVNDYVDPVYPELQSDQFTFCSWIKTAELSASSDLQLVFGGRTGRTTSIFYIGTERSNASNLWTQVMGLPIRSLPVNGKTYPLTRKGSFFSLISFKPTIFLPFPQFL